MKIAIDSRGFDGWGGGIDFLCHLMACIEAADSEGVLEKSVLIASNDVRFKTKKLVSASASFFSTLYLYRRMQWLGWTGFDEEYLRSVFSEYHDFSVKAQDGVFSKLKGSQRERFDLVLPCITPPGNPASHSAWVGYIYDFQHKYLPQFFTERQINARDRAFSEMLNLADNVIVNAQSVKDDAMRFMGDFKAQVHVLPYSPCPRDEWINESRDLGGKYGITKPYFIICNQFWVHKDHATAFRAFERFLKAEGKRYQLVCTGKTTDFRFPNHFEDLCDLCKRLGIEEDVRVLGHIPKMDQIALLKRARSVIQPTLFEGGPGGGAAYDAISLGVPLIASDIAVNREIQDETAVTFFGPGNSSDLCEKLVEAVTRVPVVVSNEELMRKGLERRVECGETLLSIIKDAVDDKLTKVRSKN